MIQRSVRGNGELGLRPAFTLVELMVVIVIIGLLISIALPAFSSAKNRAKSVASQATINAIESGLQLFRTETALGGSFPPSRSDIGASNNEDENVPAGRIVSPVHYDSAPAVRITGASLLVYALSGPDDRGTAGFRDIDGDGYWADDMSGRTDAGRLYDPNGNAPRYGPYIDGSLVEEIAEVQYIDPVSGAKKGLTKEHVIQINTNPGKYAWYGNSAYRTEMSNEEAMQRLFVDKFRRPILYYKARKHAQVMVQTPGSTGLPGTYDQRDNALLTGGYAPATSGNPLVGTGFVKDAAYYGGNSTNSRMHDISATYYPGSNYFGEMAPSGSGGELDRARRFDNFIVSKSSRGTPKAVNSDTYLLISAGPDGIYGSPDDVTNWSR